MGPNILLIVADQQRYDCVGASGLQPVATPNLDRLAAEGAFFENAFAHIPICSPARQSLITGRRPESFGAHWNYDLGPYVASISSDTDAWTKSFPSLGYKSAYVGKWHVSPTADPTGFGYDDYVPEFEYKTFRAKRYPDLTWSAGFVGETDPVPLDDAETHVMADHAIQHIERLSQLGEPWHVRLDFSGPHLPSRPVKEFEGLYSPDEIAPWPSFDETFRNKPYIQRQQRLSWGIEDWEWADFAPMVARYFGLISQIDNAVGRVLRAIDDMGCADNTLVIYTSDHGDLCGAHRMIDKHYVLYEDIVHVPLLVRWPSRVPKGLRVTELVYNFLDLPPTLLEIMGGVVGTSFHGQSMLPLMLNQPTGHWRDAVVATYHGQQFGLYTQRMIRTRRWKYIWNATDVDELYDLAEDPHELVNLIHNAEHTSLLRELRRRLYEVLVSQGDRQVDNSWIRRQLLEGRKL